VVEIEGEVQRGELQRMLPRPAHRGRRVLPESGIDVAIRNREFESDSAITVRRLAETQHAPAASPQ
jgi:hypothetical protein